MDLKKIAADLVTHVESIVKKDDEKGDIGVAGRIDTVQEESIFKEELAKKQVDKYEDIKEIWGFAKSGKTSAIETQTPVTRATTAPQTRANGEPIVINVNNEINWYIDIDISVDLSEELKEYIEKLMENQDQNFGKLIEFLKKEGAQNTDIILAAVKELFEAYEANNDKDHEELMELLNKMSEQLEAQGIKIDNLNGMVADLVNNSFEVMEMMGVELGAIKETIENAVEKQEMTQQQQIDALALINESILQLTSKFDKHSDTQVIQLNQLLGMVGKQGVTLQKILDLLKAIKQDTSENCKIGKALLDLVEKNGIEMTTQLTNIYNKIVEKADDDKAVQAEFLEILYAIKDDTGKIRETNLEILEKLGNLDASMVEQFTKMYNLILQGNDSDKDLQLDKFKQLLENIEGAINNLGNKFDAGLKEGVSTVVEAINNKKVSSDTNVTVDLSGIEALLNNLLEEVKNNNKIDTDGFKDVLAKLEGMANNAGGDVNVKVDLSKIEGLLSDIKTITGENGDKLNNILANQDVLRMFLEDFANMVYEQTEMTEEQLNIVISKIDKLINKVGTDEGCNVDGAALLTKLQEILTAIKDKECECNCNPTETPEEDNNESVVTDMDKIFTARMVTSPGPSKIDNAEVRTQDGEYKKLLINNAVYLFKYDENNNLDVRNLNGVKIADSVIIDQIRQKLEK